MNSFSNSAPYTKDKTIYSCLAMAHKIGGWKIHHPTASKMSPSISSRCSYTVQRKQTKYDSAYRAFLLTAKITKTRAFAGISKALQAAPIMSSILASVPCLLASQVWHRGRQVKFLSKKSSLQVRLVNASNGGSMADPIMPDEPIIVECRN